MKNIVKNNWKGFLAGFCLACILCGVGCFIYSQTNKPVVDTDDGLELEPVTTDPSEDIAARDVEIDTGDAKITLHTPENYYYLTEQYRANMASYYQIEMKDVNMFTVGNHANTTESDILINASTINDYRYILSQLYQKDEADFTDADLSPAYYYFKNGEIPEAAPTNYDIKEVEKITVGDHTYTVFFESYDIIQQYTVSENQTEKYTTHCETLTCYSDTENALEIICYVNEDKMDEGIALLKQCLGAE